MWQHRPKFGLRLSHGANYLQAVDGCRLAATAIAIGLRSRPTELTESERQSRHKILCLNASLVTRRCRRTTNNITDRISHKVSRLR